MRARLIPLILAVGLACGLALSPAPVRAHAPAHPQVMRLGQRHRLPGLPNLATRVVRPPRPTASLTPLLLGAPTQGSKVNVVATTGSANAPVVSQFTLSNSSQTALAARTGRWFVIIENLDGTNAAWINFGSTAANSSTSQRLNAGESIQIPTQAAVTAIAGAGTPVISFTECF